MIKGKCGYEGCQYDIKPAETQAKFNRNKGLHLRIAHGVVGAWRTPEGRKLFYQNRVKKGQIPFVESKPETAPDLEAARRRHRLEYQAEYRERKKRESHQQSSAINNNAAKLKFICPDCGARVFTTPAP